MSPPRDTTPTRKCRSLSSPQILIRTFCQHPGGLYFFDSICRSYFEKRDQNSLCSGRNPRVELPKIRCSQPEVIGRHLAMYGDISGSRDLRGGCSWNLAGRGQGRMLLNIQQCTGPAPPPSTRYYPGQNVNRFEVEKSCLK